MNKYLHTLLFILTPSLLFAQYCSPAYLTYGLTSGVMARFAANGSGSSFINDSLPASSVTSGYVARVTSVPALNVVQGRNYSCTIIYYSPASATGNQIFIDFDNNNVFDVGEEVSTVEPATYAFGTSTPYATLNIYIPPSAALGTHRMRVRNVGYNISSSAGFGSANFDACADRDATNQYYKGVTADYLVNISTASSCSGSPYAGDITGVSSICQNTPFSLNLINDSVALGLEYQWFSRPVGSGTMTAISGATNRVYNVGLQSVSTIYQAMVTCTTSSRRDSTATFTVNQTPFTACYCNAALGGLPSDVSIDSVSLAGTTLNASSPGRTAVYTAFGDTGSARANVNRFVSYTLFLKTGSTRNYNAYMWIDYNNNGSFDSSEYMRIALSATASGLVYYNFTIPISADTGATLMRIRVVNDSTTLSYNDACSYRSNGQIHDYFLHINAAAICAGTPYAGTVSAADTAVCPSTSFYVLTTGYSASSGLTFQWYSRPVGSLVYSIISGATNTLYTVASQSIATEYAIVVTCSSTVTRDTSAPFRMGMKPTSICYCSPTTGTRLNDYAFRANIDSFAVAGTSISNNTAGSTTTYARYYPTTSTTTATFTTGTCYDLLIKSTGIGSTYNAGVWIDYNGNGVFESVEYTALATGAPIGTTRRTSLLIPATAVPGGTGMRIRVADGATVINATDACTNMAHGSTADYVITIANGTNCSGRPSGGAAVGSRFSVCSGQPIVLTNPTATTGLGISYQWLSRNAGASTYSPISGATLLTYTVPTQSVSKEYALAVRCSTSGLSDTSRLVTIFQNPFYTCYCSPTLGLTLNDTAIMAPLDSFSVMSTGILNNTRGTYTVYAQYDPTMPGTFASLNKGSTYIAALNSYGTGSYKSAMWIDYNNNGTFDTVEYIPIARYATASGIESYAVFTIPLTTDTGYTALRLRSFTSTDSVTNRDACTYFYNGATQDYQIEILPPQPCSARPTAGSILSAVTSVCPNQPFRLLDDGFTSDSGTVYQWYKAPTGTGTYTAIAGAISPTYIVATQSAATDYIFTAKCLLSGLTDTTSPYTVQMNPNYVCYCSPTTGSALHTYTSGSPADSVSIAGTTLRNGIPGNTRLYQLFYPTTATTTANITQGNRYSIYVKSTGSGNYNAVAWIDFDHNGTYDTAEYVIVGANIPAGTLTSASVLVPYISDTGYTGMRVRFSRVGYFLRAADACTYADYGATQDYVLYIAPGTPCTGTPNAGRILTTPTAVCPGVGFLLSDTGYTVGARITYQWSSRPASGGSFTAISGATNPNSLIVSSISVSTEYRLSVTCLATGLSSSASSVTITANPFYNCYCNSPLGTSPSQTLIDYVEIPATTLRIRGYRTEVYKQFAPVGDSTGTLQRSLAYTINLHVAGTGGTFSAGMWIDYNHNSTFETTEFVLLDSVVAAGTSSTTTFTIPAGADTGYTGMRIRAINGTGIIRNTDACTNIYYSQTYDFRVKIDTLNTCSGTPDAGSIASSSAFACPSMTFMLSNRLYAVGTGLTYQWWKRNTGTSAFTAITGATNHTYTVSGQTVSTDYVLIARCSRSGLIDSTNILTIVEYPFDSCYCSPPTGVRLVTTGGHREITGVTIVGTTMYVPMQTPDSTGYVYVPPTTAVNTATMYRRTSYPVSVFVAHTSYTITDAGLWIDYNHNSLFDSVEYTRLTQSTDRSTWSATIAIPATALTGLTGMRVVTTESGTLTSSGSCTRISTGQVQDHIVTLLQPPCYAISSATISRVTDTSAFVTWGRLAGAAGYQYKVDTFSTDPTTGYINTTDTFANPGCLTSNKNYYVHIRDSCGAGDFSSWTTFTFRTNACTPVASITTSSVGYTTATFNWTAVTGSRGYQYVVNTTAADPTGAGTSVSAGPVSLTSLTPGTQYYIHLRSGCGCSNQSVWYAATFTTICDTVRGLGVFGISDTSATLSWLSSSSSGSYSYTVDTLATTAGAGAVATTDTFGTVTRLVPGRYYYAHVRHNCTSTNSGWVTVPFRTSFCDTVTGLTAVGDDTSVTMSWTGVSGSVGYRYVVTSTAADPGGLGTLTTSTFALVTPLAGGRTWYAHVRTECSGGRSAWRHVAFTTSPCDSVRGLRVVDICDTGVTLNWSVTAGINQFVYVLNNTAATPTVAGTRFIGFTKIFDTLRPGTTYYFHIRHRCSTVDSSAWTVISFRTPNCDPPSFLNITHIGTAVATLNWSAATCVSGYEYAVTTFATPPSSGIAVSGTTSVTATGLTPVTNYYAHVRVNCGNGLFTSWITTRFTTLACDPTVITVQDLSSTGATVTWLPFPGALNYYISIDDSPTIYRYYASPITDTYYVAIGLLPSTTYYAHVKVVCPGSQLSPWTDTPLITLPAGIDGISTSGFGLSLFPNPANDELTVMVTEWEPGAKISITDLAGKTMICENIAYHKHIINLSQLAQGMYMVRYEDKKRIKVMKLSKL